MPDIFTKPRMNCGHLTNLFNEERFGRDEPTEILLGPIAWMLYKEAFRDGGGSLADRLTLNGVPVNLSKDLHPEQIIIKNPYGWIRAERMRYVTPYEKLVEPHA